MRSKLFLLVAGMALSACSSATQVTPTPQPKPTDPPKPTTTETEIPETDIPPQPTATNTPQPTLTTIPTDSPPPLQINFTPYENNPILEGGVLDDWDLRVVGGRVVLVNGTFYLFYTGWGADTNGLGYAVSSDGFTFTKSDANPIFQSDGKGFDALAIRAPTPLVVGDTWMLYYNGSGTDEPPRHGVMGSSIGLTTAAGPNGPWTQGQLVLNTGSPGEWDEGFIIPESVFATDEGYRMYYTAGVNPEILYRRDQQNDGSGAMCGMATSTDGSTWTKYDDPSTTEAPFAESDPVMQPSSSEWDAVDVICSVIMTETGWEMIYQGLGKLSYAKPSKYGYATSPDGVTWGKYQHNPIFLGDQDPLGLDDYMSYPSALKDGSTYYLYYSYTPFGAVMGVASGTITEP